MSLFYLEFHLLPLETQLFKLAKKTSSDFKKDIASLQFLNGLVTSARLERLISKCNIEEHLKCLASKGSNAFYGNSG